MNKFPLKDRFETGGKFQKAQEKTFSSILSNKSKNILEIGCGKGYFSYIAAKYKKINNLFGVDIYRDFQEKELKKIAKKVEYRSINKKNIPYKDNVFNSVFSMDVIEHVSDDKFFAKEHIRVCKKSGQVIIGTPNYYRLTNLPLIMTGRLKYPRDMGSDTYGRCIHLREYKKEELQKMAKYFENKKMITNVKIIPCWLGVMAINIGIDKFPKIFEKYCQFWFLVFTNT